jgi:hypothetical protein
LTISEWIPEKCLLILISKSRMSGYEVYSKYKINLFWFFRRGSETGHHDPLRILFRVLQIRLTIISQRGTNHIKASKVETKGKRFIFNFHCSPFKYDRDKLSLTQKCICKDKILGKVLLVNLMYFLTEVPFGVQGPVRLRVGPFCANRFLIKV